MGVLACVINVAKPLFNWTNASQLASFLRDDLCFGLDSGRVTWNRILMDLWIESWRIAMMNGRVTVKVNMGWYLNAKHNFEDGSCCPSRYSPIPLWSCPFLFFFHIFYLYWGQQVSNIVGYFSFYIISLMIYRCLIYRKNKIKRKANQIGNITTGIFHLCHYLISSYQFSFRAHFSFHCNHLNDPEYEWSLKSWLWNREDTVMALTSNTEDLSLSVLLCHLAIC